MKFNFSFSLKAMVLMFLAFGNLFAQSKKNVLVFSKTAGFRHQSIEAGQKALQKMANEKGFNVTFTEDASLFNENNLKNYATVVFLSTTGDVLNPTQEQAFERYIQAGGGYVGIHAATDTEYDWPWYNKLAGAYFLSHPSSPSNVQNGRFFVTEKNQFTEHMPAEFERKDEFYSFKNISDNIKVFLKIDEKTYQGGANGDDHPISWYQEFDGGRSFYTAMGHTDETYSEPLFLDLLYAGINYTSSGAPIDFSKARPEENRFTKVVLADKLDEPMELSVLNDGRILFIQRKGEVRIFNTNTNELKTIATIPVNIFYEPDKDGKRGKAEDGLLGLNKDPNFDTNHWIYLFYSSTKGDYNQLSRFTLNGDELDLNSEVEMLRVPTQRAECCHTGGSIAWDKMGNLYLSTGDNTNPHASNGYSPSDERPGRGPWDAQKSSANTNDLRGKIIRIKPQSDGTYTIPEGNLFPVGTPKTRPEIYSMGHRNPFRISVDPHTGYVYWGEVGPDARDSDDKRGPAGHDEVGQARKPGNFGWPHFVGDNKAYNKYDFETKKSFEKWDVNAPTNTSPNNTGLETLPPAQKAFIWYPYGNSPEFPLVGTGGRNAMAGPVYYANDFKNAERPFPGYYDKKLLTYDWMRGWVMAITMNENGDFKSMERFMPSYKFSNPMDMEFANNGDLYMLEYGSGWFSANDDARLFRIEYNAGNRKPNVKLQANKLGGQVPLNLEIKTDGTVDPDNDDLSYTWTVSSANGYNKTFNTKDLISTLSDKGVYDVTLKVDDKKGGVSESRMEIIAGNEAPVISLEIPNGNKSFYVAGRAFNYNVDAKDKEDGSIGKGINPEEISVKIDYLPEGYDKVEIAQGHRSADESANFARGKKLIAGSDCMACHAESKKSIGPSYLDIANKYKDNKDAVQLLSKKVIQGGSGVWGEVPMAGHPQLSESDAKEMVSYILNIGKKEKGLPSQGEFEAKLPKNDKGIGVYIIRAAYKDNGSGDLPSLSTEQNLVLRNAQIGPHSYDDYKDINKMEFNGQKLAIASKSGAYMTLNNVDLSGVESIEFTAMAPKPQLNAVGGIIELRLDSPTGQLVGSTENLAPGESLDFKPSNLSASLNINDGKLHDLYLVFVNKDNPMGNVMIVTGSEVKLKNSGREIKSNTGSTGFFDGRWKIKLTGLPTGDANMIANLKRVDGKLRGQILDENNANPIPIDKIEEDNDEINLFFKSSGFQVNLDLKKEDEDNLIGKMMGRFDAKANRIN